MRPTETESSDLEDFQAKTQQPNQAGERCSDQQHLGCLNPIEAMRPKLSHDAGAPAAGGMLPKPAASAR